MRYHYISGEAAEKHTEAVGEISTFLATAAETDGRVSIFDSHLPAGNSAPWHYHEIDDEIFYVISGEVEFGVAEDVFVGRAGDLVIAGPHVPRRFKALVDSHLLVVNSPAGPSEGFLRDLHAIEGPPTASDLRRFIEQYGVRVMQDRTEDTGSTIAAV